MVVGCDFTAGHERARVDALRGLLRRPRARACTCVEPVTADGLTVSSTKIREFLLEGNVEAAAVLLTRPHDVDGRVERGAGRGRGFGFATANLRPEALLPANGVYAVRALVGIRVGESGVTEARDATSTRESATSGSSRPSRRPARWSPRPTSSASTGATSTGSASGWPSWPACATSGASPRWTRSGSEIALDVEAARAALRQPPSHVGRPVRFS